MNKIEIPLSRTKLLTGLGGSMLFVFLGIWLFTHESDLQNSSWMLLGNPLVIKGVGVASILFFGATSIYGIKKRLDTNIGLIIDDEGIIDNTNAASIGRIKWSDITEISTRQLMSTKFLLIFTKDPNGILEKASGMKRKLLASSMTMYGTPISITSTTLKYNFSDLEKLLKDKLQEHRDRVANP